MIVTICFIISVPVSQSTEAGVFGIVPNVGYLQAYVTHVSNSKMVLRVQFTAKWVYDIIDKLHFIHLWGLVWHKYLHKFIYSKTQLQWNKSLDFKVRIFLFLMTIANINDCHFFFADTTFHMNASSSSKVI